MALSQLVGKLAVDYNLNKGVILKAVRTIDFKDIVNYDNSGWLCEEAIGEYELKDTDILVAFKSDEGTEVFTLGMGGVDLI